ncbi:MAG: hypothetical protein IKB46_02695 [Paludibacteraceae bacterium]|nr:hypothetical protein [Paludibacteraceae bacterium]
MKKLLFLLLLSISQVAICAQEVPQWVQKKPKPANDTYLYVVERGVGATEMEARNRAMGLVYRSTIERLALPINLASINEAINNGSNYGDNAEVMNIPVNKVCEYIQQEATQYAVYVLCQVAQYGNREARFTAFTQCNLFVEQQDIAPFWCNDTWRATNYPREQYVQGFIIGTIQTGETIEQTYQRLKEKAQAEALQNIIATQNAIKDIPNLSVESWHNLQTNEVFAFAWAKKEDLVRTLKKQIISHITRAEMAIEEAEGLLAEGEKSAARKAITKAIEHLQQVEEQQQVAQNVDATTNMEDIAFAESNALKQRATVLQQQLKNAVNVYVGGEIKIFGKSYPLFIQQIKQEISLMGCTFTTNEAEADWVVRLQGTTQEYNTLQNSSYSAFVVMADVTIEIAKRGQIIYSGNVSQKGVHTINIEQAAKEAYSEASKAIAAQSNEIINN